MTSGEAPKGYLEGLNEAQREAVTTTEGPLLIVAGAGSGKTRVLTYRIAHLMEQGVEPANILALTFTNKAADVMKGRIAEVVGQGPASKLCMGTFHSVFLRILREEAPAIGFTPSFSVYDTADTKSTLTRVIKDLNLSTDDYPVRRIAGRISMAKNNLALPSYYCSNEQIMRDDLLAKVPETGKIYTAYQKRLRSANAMDFDDILVFLFLLLHKNPSVLQKYQERFRYIMVDEYQDTNEVQNRILFHLAQQHQNLCVVGDDAQSIYAFRGAKIQNILNFSTRFPRCRKVTLATNYRSTDAIVQAANRLIAHNANQIPKQCIAATGGGTAVHIEGLGLEDQEAQYVAASIQETAHRERATYDKFAILFRANSQSRNLEVALRERNIPCRPYGSLSFWERREVREFMGYVQVMVNPNDDQAIQRVINFPPRGIGDTTVNTLLAAAREKSCSLWEIISDAANMPQRIRPNTQLAITQFAQLVQQFQGRVNVESALEIAREIFDSTGIRAFYEADTSEEAEMRLNNIGEIFNAIQQFVDEREESEELATLPEFLDKMSLLSEFDTNNDSDEPQVILATMHSAKGLEFDYVYVVGLVENVFPSARSLQEADGLEEERRLCYVAVTRAAKMLTLTYSRVQRNYGQLQKNSPSRFLREIDPQFVSASDQAETRRRQMREQQEESYQRANGVSPDRRSEGRPQAPKRLVPVAKLASSGGANTAMATDPSTLSEGCRVRHADFGIGVVVKLQDEGFTARAIVKFENAGEKILVLKFATLTRL